MAHKKAAGIGRNGRDSNAQFLGIKRYAGEAVTAGSILIRQRGTKWHAGRNVRMGGDNTLFSLVDGVVKFDAHRRISVYPAEAPTNKLALPETEAPKA